MKIGIIGANGQVGRELAIVLKNRGHEIFPIVRNPISAQIFEQRNMSCLIGDVTNKDESKEMVDDLDIIIITAFTSYFTNGFLKPKKNRGVNKKIIENPVKYANHDAVIIYFSSIAAFGGSIRKHGDQHWYTKEKRRLENIIQKTGEETGKDTYSYRLGHVFGPTQNITQNLFSNIYTRDSIYISTEYNRPSNVVHISTIADAILHTHTKRPSESQYTIVDQPQFSWGELLEIYNNSSEIYFNEESTGLKNSDNQVVKYISKIPDTLPVKKESLIGWSHLLPSIINENVSYNSVIDDVSNEIQEYRDQHQYQRREFSYEKAQGPFFNINKDNEIIYSEGKKLEKSLISKYEDGRSTIYHDCWGLQNVECENFCSVE